jgi:hypothetical protein
VQVRAPLSSLALSSRVRPADVGERAGLHALLADR